MTTAAASIATAVRPVPAAQVSADQYRAFAALTDAAGHRFAQAGGDPFAVLVAGVRPFALATLAAPLDDDEDAIAVLDEAQFHGRCVTFAPRPDWGYSLSVATARDSWIDAPDRGNRIATRASPG